MKIKTGDNVQIIAGKDRGKTGKVIQTFPKLNKIVIEGVNTRTKHMRSQQAGQKGQKIEFSAPIHVSNVKLIDPKSNKPTRVGYTILEDGKKKRIAKVSKEIIDN